MSPWLIAVQVIGIFLFAGVLIVVSMACAMTLFMVFLGFGIPCLMRGLECTIVVGERVWDWTVRHRRPLVVSFVTVFASLFAAVWQWYFYWDTSDVPDMMEMVRYAPPQIGYVYDADGDVMAELATVFRKPVQYDELPFALERATIAAEDKDFYQHDGVPVLCVSMPFASEQVCFPVAVELVYRWLTGKGGSTLTMQLVRNHYLADMLARERSDELVYDSWWTRWLASKKSAAWVNRRLRKFREIKYALHLERQLTDYGRRQLDAQMRERGIWFPQRMIQSRVQAKRRAKELLMARYLSTVYYGYSMYGPDSASRFYFNKPMADLTVDEAALLASFAPAPSRYAQIADINGTRAEQKTRRDRIIRRMGEKGFINSAYDCGRPENWWDAVRWFARNELPRGDCVDDVAEFTARPISLVGRIPGGRTDAPASVQAALDEIEQRGFSDRRLFNGDIRIHTTNNAVIQRVVTDAAQYGARVYREHYGTENGLPQVAVVVLRNFDAAILAQFGGFTENIPNSWTYLDRSRKSWRQSGSIFKAFVYLAALSQGGHTADSVVNDDRPYPVRMGGGSYHYVRNYTDDYRGWMPFREAVAQSRNVPAMHVGMEYTDLDAVIETARSVGIRTPLRREPSTILGSGDITVLELANGFRAIASGGITATPYSIDHITDSFNQLVDRHQSDASVSELPASAFMTMQELLRGAVRLPSGTSRALQPLSAVPLMCKTGTSNRFADARITCATYGPGGITVSVWVGHDGSTRSLGDLASGGRLALPIARYIFERVYDSPASRGRSTPLGRAPLFPTDMEARIDEYLERTYGQP